MKRCCCAPIDKFKYGRVLAESRLLLPSTSDMSEKLQKVLVTLKNDDISLVIKNDPIIRQLGEKLCFKKGNNEEHYTSIRNTLREVGRLLIHLRKSVGPSDARLEYFLNPAFHKQVLLSTRCVAGFCHNSMKFDVPLVMI